MGQHMMTSTSNIEVESYQVECDEVSEFATLGSMNFKVFPAEQVQTI